MIHGLSDPRSLHLGAGSPAMRPKRCCACQPIEGERAEKDDIIGKLGQMQRIVWLLCVPARFSTEAVGLSVFLALCFTLYNIDILKEECIFV